MSNYSEKTKKIIRFFAAAEGPKTIDDLISYLGLDSREEKLGKRKVRHTVGDLTYDGILRSWKPPNRNHHRYKITALGKKIASEFHICLPSQSVRVFNNAQETSEESDKIIPKENIAVAPPTPALNLKTKTITMVSSSPSKSLDLQLDIEEAKQVINGLDSSVEDALSKFEALYDSNPEKAVKALAKQVIKTREELRELKDSLRFN